MSNSLDSDQARHFVRPDLGPNCFQKLSADETIRQRVNKLYNSFYLYEPEYAAPKLRKKNFILIVLFALILYVPVKNVRTGLSG